MSKADLETVISDLMFGQYSDPVRVVAFNTAEQWSADVSQEVAHEIRRRAESCRDQVFYDPIVLPNGKKLITLRDAAEYITELPKAEHDTREWQAAMEALLLVAENSGPPMFARIGVMRALNRNVVRTFNSSRKDTHWGRRKLRRDQ
jgi:hypothetical protein